MGSILHWNGWVGILQGILAYWLLVGNMGMYVLTGLGFRDSIGNMGDILHRDYVPLFPNKSQ